MTMKDLSPAEVATVDEIVTRIQRGMATASAQDGFRAIMRRSREQHGDRHETVKAVALSRAYGGHTA